MKTCTDQIGRKINTNEIPSRIVSLVPSQTELLFDLGLNDEVVGITKFCIYPEQWYKQKRKIGGTKSPNFDVIKSLSPDLIIGNKEENKEEDIIALEKIAPVWVSNVNSLDDALEMINNLGDLVGRKYKARRIVENIRKEFSNLKWSTPRKVIYFIWKDPYMVAGKNTFIDAMLSAMGWENIITQSRYPEWKFEILNYEHPDLILLSTEPYPFKEKDLYDFSRKFPKAKVILVNGEYFSWYGSRIMNSPNYFKTLVNF